MKLIAFPLFCLLPFGILAQTTLTGNVLDENSKPLPYATATLLKPADSTLVYFGITNEQGGFEIKKVNRGNYLLQVASMGFQTYSKPLQMPEQSGDYGIVVLKSKPINLASAEIIADQVPIILKKDTIEYNAAAFKTQPNAVVEDLLKKLPGVEVDRSGNIKAMGEDVKNVMVDGKEFFSSDPKVATKNLPADAVSKVQVYDKKSEESQLAGIDDGLRDKTINLLLKEGKKQAWLGDASAGAGTNERYATSAKIYRFTTKNQFAMLGMLNNINRFGFSFQDYIDFNGGLPAMMGSGSMKLTFTSDNEMPVDFGQTVNGLVTSGAAGLNYSFDLKKNSRFYACYIGNGSKRELDQSSFTRNFISQNEFTENETNSEKNSNYSHRLSLGWKDKSDSTRTMVFNGSLGLTDAMEDAASLAKAFSGDDLINQLEAKANLKRNNVSGNGSFSFMQRGRGALKLVSLRANAGFTDGLNNSDRLNLTRRMGLADPVIEHQFRDNQNKSQNYGVSGSGLFRIGNGLYLEPELRATASNETLDRKQGFPGDEMVLIDSLSPLFERLSLRFTPGLSLRRNFSKMKFMLGLSSAIANSRNTLNSSSAWSQRYARLLPSFNWEFDYKTGHRISLDYTSSTDDPQFNFLLPVVDNSNPQALFYGNCYLKPENRHDLFANWLLFDAFSQTSVFARLGGTYTTDKVGFARFITDSLVQSIHLINTKNAFNANGNIEFTTPVKFAGLNLHLALDGRWNKGISYVNDIENVNTTLSRSVSLSLDNRKKEKWDMSIGGEVTLTNSKYSIQESLNNSYLTLNYFADLSFNPNESWHFGIKADVVNYSSGSFKTAVNIPIISTEASFAFLANKRGMLILESYDLLDKNKGIERISEMNYLREVRSNIIGRYAMLSFKYRINKAAKAKGGLEINMRKR